MKKILFIVPSMVGGGVERCMLNILHCLDQSKYDITVLAIMSGGELIDALPAGVHYRYCWKRNLQIGKLRLPGTDRLFKWIFTHMSSKRLHKWFVKEKYDAEIDYWGQEGLKLILGSDESTKKIVFTHTDMNTESMRNSNFPYASKEALRKAYLQADVIANVSKDCRQSMIDRFAFTEEEQKKLIVSYNVNLTDIILEKAKDSLDICKTEKFTMCACGRLIQLKGYSRLIDICERLKQDGFDFTLWILGIGEEKEHLEQKICELGLQEQVQMLGFQENPYPYMANADLFVCSSFYEGFSTVVSEAVILGVPSVTTNCTGAKEILGESEFGLVTELDDESLYQGLKRMLSDSDLYQHYKEKVLQRQAFFDMNTRMEAFEALL